MAPNVTLQWWAPNLINGDPIFTLTDENPSFRGLILKPDLYGLGGWELRVARKLGQDLVDAGAFQAEAFMRVLVHAYSDTEYFFGGQQEKREAVVIHVDEDGGEEYVFGGPGPKSYLARAALRPETFTGSDWHLDEANGVWRWKTTATWTGVMRRIILEDQASDAPALPALTYSFDFDDDSAGNDPDEVGGADEFELPIGQDYLSCLWDLEDTLDGTGGSSVYLGTTDMPEYRLDLWQSFGSDVGASSFASGKVLFREGVNIVNDSLTVEGVALKKCTHVIVEGKDHTYVTVAKATWSAGDYVKLGKTEYARSRNTTVLTRVGRRWLRRQDNGDQEYSVEILPGADDAEGLYFPQVSGLQLGNIVALDTTKDGGTTHTPLDILPATDQLVTGYELTLGDAAKADSALHKARSWAVVVKLNVERGGNSSAPSQASASTPGGGGGGNMFGLCQPTIPGTDPVGEVTSRLWSFLASGDGGDSLVWSGLLGNQPAHSGTHGYWKSAGSPSQNSDSMDCTPGQHLRVSVWGYAGASNYRLAVRFCSSAPGTPGIGVPANTIRTDDVWNEGNTGSGNWVQKVTDLIVPAGADSFAIGWNGSGCPNFDDLLIDTITTEAVEGTDPVVGDCPEDVALECDPGTGSKASRCDHVHAHGNLSDDGTHAHNVGDIQGGAAATGQQVVAHPHFMTPSAAATGGTAGRAYAMPISIVAPMKLRNLSIRVNATGTGTVQWGLFNAASNAAACTKVAGGSAVLNATGWRTIAASGAPVSVAPGSYILILHLPASNQPSLFFDSGAGSPGYCKIQSSYTWSDTPNLTTGWSSEQVVFACYLRGDMDGSNQW